MIMEGRSGWGQIWGWEVRRASYGQMFGWRSSNKLVGFSDFGLIYILFTGNLNPMCLTKTLDFSHPCPAVCCILLCTIQWTSNWRPASDCKVRVNISSLSVDVAPGRSGNFPGHILISRRLFSPAVVRQWRSSSLQGTQGGIDEVGRPTDVEQCCKFTSGLHIWLKMWGL